MLDYALQMLRWQPWPGGGMASEHTSDTQMRQYSPIAQLAEHQRPDDLAQAPECERVRLVQVLLAHPVLLGDGRALVPLLVVHPAVLACCAGKKNRSNEM